MLFFCNVNLQFRIKRENPSFHLTNVKSLGRWKILIKLSNKTKYSLFKNWREYNNSYLHISRSKNIEVKIGISTSSIYSYMLQIHQKCITYVLSHTYYLGDAAKALPSVRNCCFITFSCTQSLGKVCSINSTQYISSYKTHFSNVDFFLAFFDMFRLATVSESNS